MVSAVLDISDSVRILPPSASVITKEWTRSVRLDDTPHVRGNQTIGSELPTIVSIPQERPVTWTQIVSGRWLLAASSDRTTSVLSLWSIPYPLTSLPDNTPPIANVYLPAPVRDGRVEVYTIKHLNNTPVFCPLDEHPNTAYIRYLHGDWIGFALHNDVNVPCILNRSTGQFAALFQKPRPEGGCVAMAMEDMLIAVLTRKRLYIFVANVHQSGAPPYTLWLQAEIPVSVAYAQLMFDSAYSLTPFDYRARLLHICITGHDGIYYYQVDCAAYTQDAQGFILNCAWHRGYKSKLSEGEIIAIKPEFGRNARTLSWLEHSFASFDRPTSFAAARLEDLIRSQRTEVPTIQNDATIAQYFMGVRDYDDTRGLAVFGNGFGELSLHALSRTGAEGSSTPVIFPPVVDTDQIKSVPMESEAIPPFPYGQRPDVDLYLKNALLKRSQLCPPKETLSRGWSLGIPSAGRDEHVPVVLPCPTTGWIFEDGHFFYGHIVPLVRGDECEIFNIGGLNIVITPDGEELSPYVLQSDDNIFTLTETLQTPRSILRSSKFVLMPEPDMTKKDEYERYTNAFTWERETANKDRWQGLKTRGGCIDDTMIGKLRLFLGREQNGMNKVESLQKSSRGYPDTISPVGVRGEREMKNLDVLRRWLGADPVVSTRRKFKLKGKRTSGVFVHNGGETWISTSATKVPEKSEIASVLLSLCYPSNVAIPPLELMPDILSAALKYQHCPVNRGWRGEARNAAVQFARLQLDEQYSSELEELPTKFYLPLLKFSFLYRQTLQQSIPSSANSDSIIGDTTFRSALAAYDPLWRDCSSDTRELCLSFDLNPRKITVSRHSTNSPRNSDFEEPTIAHERNKRLHDALQKVIQLEVPVLATDLTSDPTMVRGQPGQTVVRPWSDHGQTRLLGSLSFDGLRATLYAQSLSTVLWKRPHDDFVFLSIEMTEKQELMLRNL
ncbi:hypothetical protein K474DRAFT_1680580 [Panus rudis PR-1116 ss-1]|nr:hypothetical protein K474DRAFT_1680580 [Panus rudis PR-1116 ss-1]